MIAIGMTAYIVGSHTNVSVHIAKLHPQITSAAGILSSYSFTVAGFLATISTFLFTLGDKPFFKFFKNSKSSSFGTLMFIHLLTFVSLGILFIVSLFLTAYPKMLTLALSLTVLTLCQLFLITTISYKLTSRSNS